MSSGYLAPSTYTSREDGEAIDLQTALASTPAGHVQHPEFFRGFLARPEIVTSALLAVADVAATTYADFGLAKRIANLDPVVTASGDRLRFESFSACNGVHARLDLLADGIDSGSVSFGTTNVDINQRLRTALSGIGRGALVHLAVGNDELRLSTPTETHLERQVDLPERWIRGFGETPLLAHDMTLVTELRGPAVGTFLGGLPRVAPPGPDLYLVPKLGGLRPSLSKAPGGLLLAGSSRLRAAQRVMRFATRLHVHASSTGASGWVLTLPGARLTLLLTAGAYRGFSGEGSLLSLLSSPRAEDVGAQLHGALAWEPTIDPPDLANRLRLSLTDVEAGVAWLSASGRVGFDLAEQTWFHRELPIDSSAIIRRQPRLNAAQSLVERGRVSRVDAGWGVLGSHGTSYTVRIDGALRRCECAWEAKHHGTRGPCKHILAVLLS